MGGCERGCRNFFLKLNAGCMVTKLKALIQAELCAVALCGGYQTQFRLYYEKGGSCWCGGSCGGGKATKGGN